MFFSQYLFIVIVITIVFFFSRNCYLNIFLPFFYIFFPSGAASLSFLIRAKNPPPPPLRIKKRIVFRYCHPLIITKESKLYMYRTKWYIILNGWSRPCSPFCFKVHHAFYRVIIIELYKVDNGQVLSLYYVDC